MFNPLDTLTGKVATGLALALALSIGANWFLFKDIQSKSKEIVLEAKDKAYKVIMFLD